MLVRMATRLCALTVPGGTLIVSGVTRDEEAAVIVAFQSAGAALIGRIVEDDDNEWVGLRFTTRR
jgi:ribosomal protein L11 methylase PrmA